MSLKHNDMTGIPAEIGQLANLQELDYSFNNLDTMPNEIKNMRGLRKLSLAHNRYREFPKEMWHIPNLEYLDLSYNDLSSLPDEISQLRRLKVLKLTGNRLSSKDLERIRRLLPSTQVAAD